MRYITVLLFLITLNSYCQTLTISKRENIDSIFIDKYDSVHIAFSRCEYPFHFFFYQTILSHPYSHYDFNIRKIGPKTYYSTKLNYHSGINRFCLIENKPKDTTKPKAVCCFEIGEIVKPTIKYKIRRNKIIFNTPVFYEYPLTKTRAGVPFDFSQGGYYYSDAKYIPKRNVQGIVQGFSDKIVTKDLPKGEYFIWVQSLDTAIVINNCC